MDNVTASKSYKMLGTTDEVTSCDCCGRENLKGTVVLERTDDGVIVYFGSQCGARAIGWTTKEFNTQAKIAQKNRENEVNRFYNAHPMAVAERSAIKTYYDNGGRGQDAPFETWRELRNQARTETIQRFELTADEARRIIRG